eukprot:m.52914 g.52914  ORF g.52914 m.52914 type:complete len:626 (+) comp12739_c0_seq1:56-1933(+)
MYEHLRNVRSEKDEHLVSAYLHQTVQVGQLMSEFLLNRAQAHVAYQQQCQQLALQTRKKLSETVAQPNWQLNSLSPVMRACDAVLSGAESEALEYGRYADKLLEVAEDINKSLALRSKVIELLFQQRADLQVELRTVNRDLWQQKKANDGAMHALLVARQSTIRTKSEGPAKRCGLREETAYEFKRKCHNEYMLGITRANTMRTKLVSFDLIEILDAMEDTHSRTVADISKLLNEVVGLHCELYRSIITRQEQALAVIEGCAINTELSSWVNSFVATKVEPPPEIQFDPPAIPPQYIQESDSVWMKPELVLRLSDNGRDESIEQLMHHISEEVSKLATVIGEKSNLLEGATKIYHEYRRQPSFGRADDVLPELFSYRQDVRSHYTRMQCCHAELALLEGMPMRETMRHSFLRQSTMKRTRTKRSKRRTLKTRKPEDVEGRNVTFDPNVVVYEKEHAQGPEKSEALSDVDDDDDEGSETWDSTDEEEEGEVVAAETANSSGSASRKLHAVAVFDFLGDAEKHLSLQNGDIIELLSCNPEDDWWEGQLGGEKGYFPRDYVRTFTGSPKKLARTLYDYHGEAEDELSFSADQLIKIIDWDDGNGWAEGELSGKRGKFPSSYIDHLCLV